jgi:hypothetical protein
MGTMEKTLPLSNSICNTPIPHNPCARSFFLYYLEHIPFLIHQHPIFHVHTCIHQYSFTQTSTIHKYMIHDMFNIDIFIHTFTLLVSMHESCYIVCAQIYTFSLLPPWLTFLFSKWLTFNFIFLIPFYHFHWFLLWSLEYSLQM